MVAFFSDWCLEVAGEPVGLETVDPPTLWRLLAQFYCEARPAKPQPGNPSGHLYHRNTLINIRAGINRKLADLKRNIDVVRDKEFKYANGMLDGLLKKRASQGLAQYTQHHEPLEDKDQEKISTYLLGAHSSPVVLRQAVWYSLSLQFVSRGLEFHHQLRRDSFVFQSDGTGEYVTISCDTKQKNYQGGLRSSEAPSGQRMYATGGQNCPVALLKLLISKTDPNATQIFNQYRKEAVQYPLTQDVWFTDSGLSKRTFSNFLRDMCKAAGVTKRYTPHCLRTTAIRHLREQGFDRGDITFMSQHKSESSLKSYTMFASTKQKKSLSSTLSSITNRDQTHGTHETRALQPLVDVTNHATPTSGNPSVVPVSSASGNPITMNVNTNRQFMSTPGFFTSSSFTGCTFNFNSGQ